MATIAVAGLSARAMAQAAACDGFQVLALDLFGDVDTCVAASRWLAIGDPAHLRIDPALTLQALACAARHGEVLGWVPGGGFEGQPELLAEGAKLLPLLGTAPADVARLRNPAVFFEFLAANDIEHPAVSLCMPAQPAGWLIKHALGCGGWHIRAAVAADAGTPLPAQHYAQHEVAGVSMSATFVANAQDAVVLGFNEQIVRAVGARPYVYGGVIGPVSLQPAVAARVQRAVRTLSAGFALRGLCSLDFILADQRVLVLEVNPRCPASVGLYADRGAMAAHVQACLQGELPMQSPSVGEVRGNELVYARQAVALDEAAAQWLGAWPGVHDQPCAGQRFAAGDPLCSVSACGASAAEVRARLLESREALLTSLETFSS